MALKKAAEKKKPTKSEPFGLQSARRGAANTKTSPAKSNTMSASKPKLTKSAIPAAVRPAKSKSPLPVRERPQKSAVGAHSQAAVDGPQREASKKRRWDQYMSYQARTELKQKIERSVSPHLQKPQRPGLTRKQLMKLKERLGQPRARLELKRDVPGSESAHTALFQKVLRDPSPINVETANAVTKPNEPSPSSTVESMRSAL